MSAGHIQVECLGKMLKAYLNAIPFKISDLQQALYPCRQPTDFLYSSGT